MKEEKEIEVFLTFMINLYSSTPRESYNHCTFEENFYSILFLRIVYIGGKWGLRMLPICMCPEQYLNSMSIKSY